MTTTAAAAAIRELEQELDATQQRCALIERAIGGLREIYGITGDVDDQAEDVAAPVRGRRTTAAPDVDAESQVTRKALLDALKNGGGSMAPGALFKAAKVGRKRSFKKLVMQLAREKQIVRSGTGRGSIISLPRAARRDL